MGLSPTRAHFLTIKDDDELSFFQLSTDNSNRQYFQKAYSEPQHNLGWICNCASPILFYYIVWYFMISIIHDVQYNMLFSLVMEFERLLILWTNIHFVFFWACYQWIISFHHIIKYRPLWPKQIRLFIHKTMVIISKLSYASHGLNELRPGTFHRSNFQETTWCGLNH